MHKTLSYRIYWQRLFAQIGVLILINTEALYTNDCYKLHRLDQHGSCNLFSLIRSFKLPNTYKEALAEMRTVCFFLYMQKPANNVSESKDQKYRVVLATFPSPRYLCESSLGSCTSCSSLVGFLMCAVYLSPSLRSRHWAVKRVCALPILLKTVFS